MAGGKTYACLDGSVLKGYRITTDGPSTVDSGKITNSSYLRPVTTITIQ
jgi:hypothetical protein